MNTEPLVPDDVVPDENTSEPEAPSVPAFVEAIITRPLDVAVGTPEFKEILPPEVDEESPAIAKSTPEDSTVPSPMANTKLPDLPELLFPDEICTFPEDPLLVVPVEKVKCPLIPALPASKVRKIIAPDDDFAPLPDVNEMKPPVVSGVSPVVNSISAPIPISF